MNETGDPIRVAPVRRSTITPGAWGLHSVPSMLKDFQRHTSHTAHDTHWEPIAQAQRPAARAAALLSLIALPTALLAINHSVEAVSPLGALGLVPDLAPGVWRVAGLSIGPALMLAMVATQIPLLHAASGLICAACAELVLAGDGVRNTAAVAALAVLYVPPQPSRSLLIWLLGVVAYTAISTSSNFDTVLAFVLLVGTAAARVRAPTCRRLSDTEGNPQNAPHSGKRSRTETLAGIALGAVILLGSLMTPQLCWTAVLSSAIAVGSFTVFHLVGDAALISRADCITVGVLSAVAEAAVQSRIDWRQLVEVGILLPSVFLGSNSGIVAGGAGSNELSTSEKWSAWSAMDSILAHDDTRSIFYFFCLNFSFMLVQLLYSLLSHSLGLLSDSIHMFFDCLALLVGLVASILVKLPASSRFPYGLTMVETVSGFANGCLLLAISVGVLFEAFERITIPVELEKLPQLIIVSALGLVVNLVGIFAFSHAHSHGGHSHSHSQTHSHGHSEEGHDHDHSHSHADDCEGSENMHGIFLHIVADTLGSVGVIISTLLLVWTGWHGWDAVASIVISVLIFVSALPLVKSSAKSLLLQLKPSDENRLRELLTEVYLLEGVASYTVPKFWNDGTGIRGSMHVQYRQGRSAATVREKVQATLAAGGIEQFVIQMEEEGEPCWCREK